MDFTEKIHHLHKCLSEYFHSEHFVLEEVSNGRTNLNFFLSFAGAKYFLRTNIVKISAEAHLGGKTEKESILLSILGEKGLTANPIHFHQDPFIAYLIIEMIPGVIGRSFFEDQGIIMESLHTMQNMELSSLSFLERYDLKNGFIGKITRRMEMITDSEILEILKKMMQFVRKYSKDIEEDFVLTHNDFRTDNILINKDSGKAWIIDLEGCIISDSYIDPAEYYVGGVFWETFDDVKIFDYTVYESYMDKHGYTDKNKQLFIYLAEYCSYLSWISMHLSTTPAPLALYKDTFGRNKIKYYEEILPFLEERDV